jgi:hypothetical protein
MHKDLRQVLDSPLLLFAARIIWLMPKGLLLFSSSSFAEFFVVVVAAADVGLVYCPVTGILSGCVVIIKQEVDDDDLVDATRSFVPMTSTTEKWLEKVSHLFQLDFD